MCGFHHPNSSIDRRSNAEDEHSEVTVYPPFLILPTRKLRTPSWAAGYLSLRSLVTILELLRYLLFFPEQLSLFTQTRSCGRTDTLHVLNYNILCPIRL